jgi:starch-binding outer membrane protein, SusD/RagB family
VLNAGLRFLGRAIDLADAHSFSVPGSWLGLQEDMGSQRLANLARAYRARFRAHAARTPESPVDWSAVLTDAAALENDFVMYHDRDPFWHWAIIYKSFVGWANIGNHHPGMADQTDAFRQWLDDFHSEPIHTPRPFILQTPDLRFPQGATRAEQEANPGIFYSVSDESHIRPERGTWRWSYYRDHRNDDYVYGEPAYVGEVPEMLVREMRLLMAEAHYNLGDHAAAAAIVNETRTAAGLSAADAAGTNTSCVPRVPPGLQCGGLFEMLKWEKRMETRNHAGMAGYYFDSRRWGDLTEGALLHLPVPASELVALGIPPYDFGGVGGEAAAPIGTYGY